RGVGAQEDVLERVLGVGPRSRQHLAHVGEQPLAVAVVDDPVRLVVTSPEQRHQLLVGPQPQKRPVERDPRDAERCLESGGFQWWLPVDTLTPAAGGSSATVAAATAWSSRA